MRGKGPESIIKRAICEYLSYKKGCLFWVNSTVGIFDREKGIYRKNRSQFQRNGVADILGVYKGKPLAIEVKSLKGIVSQDQESFLNDFAKAGGIALVARSVDDVIQAFKLLETQEE